MSELKNKIDFLAVVSVKNANPNGDPLSGNMPRVTNDGLGEISDVCIKRKIRNRWMDMGEPVFVQSDDKKTDGCKSLSERVKEQTELAKAQKEKKKDEFAKIACGKWLDVRSFGQVFAFKDKKKDEDKDTEGVSVGVRGPVSVHPAFSVDPVSTASIQITKSVNSETKDKKSSDTMGMKHKVHSALYVVKGSINHQLAEKTGFSDEDAEKIKEALRTLFVNDSSSARPDGSMEVCRVYWWKHNCPMGQYSSAKVHRLVKVTAKIEDPKVFGDYEIIIDSLPGLELEEIEGI